MKNKRMKIARLERDMKQEDLPSDILKMIQDKKIFESREEVYHFLESYSS